MTRTWAQLKPAVLLLVLLLQVAFLDTGSLSGAVAVTFAATAAAGSALAACSLISSRLAPAVPRTRVRTAMRDREQRTAFLPQRDPDARGRRRPRAASRCVLRPTPESTGRSSSISRIVSGKRSDSPMPAPRTSSASSAPPRAAARSITAG